MSARVHETNFNYSYMIWPMYLDGYYHQKPEKEKWLPNDILLDDTKRTAIVWKPDNKEAPLFTYVLRIDRKITDQYKDAFEYFRAAIIKLCQQGITVDLEVHPSDMGLRKRLDLIETRAEWYCCKFRSDMEKIDNIAVKLCSLTQLAHNVYNVDEQDKELGNRLYNAIQYELAANDVVRYCSRPTTKDDGIYRFLRTLGVRVSVERGRPMPDLIYVQSFDHSDGSHCVMVVKQEEVASVTDKILEKFPDAKIEKVPVCNSSLTVYQKFFAIPGVLYKWTPRDYGYVRPPFLIKMVIDVVICLYSLLPVYELLPLLYALPGIVFLPRQVLVRTIESTLRSIKSICDRKDNTCRNVFSRTE